jgi:hypothetical protein
MYRNMKRVSFFIVASLISIVAMAQGGGKNDRISSLRVAFITQRLQLSPEESQQFWPVYNQFTEKLQQIKSSVKPQKSLDDMSDADTEKMIFSQLDSEQRELDLRKEYYQKLRKVISVKKIARLFRAEQDFKAELVNRIKENRNERRQLRQGND